MLSTEENAIAKFNVKSYVLDNNRLLPLFLFHLVATQTAYYCLYDFVPSKTLQYFQNKVKYFTSFIYHKQKHRWKQP